MRPAFFVVGFLYETYRWRKNMKGKIAPMNRKIFTLVLLASFCLTLCDCPVSVDENYVQKEQPHLYWKGINVVVTSVEQRS